MTTNRKQVSLWLTHEEYQRLKDWSDNERRKVSAAAKVIIFQRLDRDEQFARDAAKMIAARAELEADEQADTPEGCAAR